MGEFNSVVIVSKVVGSGSCGRAEMRLFTTIRRGLGIAGLGHVMKRPSMRIPLCLIAVAILGPGMAGAQTSTTTADGVQAILRGDYQTAVRILRPLADEDGPQPDPLAQFFMATLYESGQGVGRNSMRACGLYLSAARPPNPLVNQSLELARAIQSGLGPFAGRLCASASVDRWRVGPSASFTLGPGHSVTVDETGATVLYNGAPTRTTMARGGGPGFVHLPVAYTPLDVARPVNARRHFLQFFIWTPYKPFDGAAWTLFWSLSEVVGPDLIQIVRDQRLVTITGPEPPMSFDFESAAGVRLDANGEAEWVIRVGPDQRGAIVAYSGAR
jgi:hypothetical protein